MFAPKNLCHCLRNLFLKNPSDVAPSEKEKRKKLKNQREILQRELEELMRVTEKLIIS